MKLLEIISPVTRIRKMSVRHDIESLDKKAKDDANSQIALQHSGVYATGKQNSRDPHEFVKKLRMPSNLVHDAYYQYTKAIKPYVANNPYLPRIHTTNLVVDIDNITRPNFRMEMLHSYDAFSMETLTALGEQIFPGFVSDHNTPKMKTTHCVWKNIVDRVYNLIEHGNTGMWSPRHNEVSDVTGWITNDKKLLQAVNIIRDVINMNAYFCVDLNTDNILIRTGKYGPQLVITDPVKDGGESLVGGTGAFI